MAANTSPIFILTPNTPIVTLATASTARNPTGAASASLVTLFVAGVSGSRVDSVTFTSAASGAYAASSAMVQRIYLTDTASANPRLIAEVATATTTPSATAIGAQSIVNFTNGLLMQSGSKLQVAQSVYASDVDTFHVLAKGGDY